MNPSDIKRLQTAVGSQESGNNIYGTIGLKGGFACTTSGGVLGPVVGPFQVFPGSVYGEPAGVYRVYPQVNGPITSIDQLNVNGFTPRNPGATETASALVTGFNTDAANGKWYITVQISTLTTGAILNTPPSNFVVGVEVACTMPTIANPL